MGKSDRLPNQIPNKLATYTASPTIDSMPLPRSAPRNAPEDLTHTSHFSLFESFGFEFSRKLIDTQDAIERSSMLETTSAFGTYVPCSSDFAIFNPDNPSHSYINTIDQAAIFTYGLQMRYYKVKPMAEQTYYNDVYGENPSREYDGATLKREGDFAFLEEQQPTVLYGIYNPTALSQNLSLFAMDTTRTAEFWFNIVYFRQQIDRDPMVGDIIVPWDIPEIYYELISVTPSNRTLYVPRRWKITAQTVQWSR